MQQERVAQEAANGADSGQCFNCSEPATTEQVVEFVPEGKTAIHYAIRGVCQRHADEWAGG